MTIAQIIDAVEEFAPSVGCAAIEISRNPRSVRICMSPNEEIAGWSGDLRISVRYGNIEATLEHSGPVGWHSFDDSTDGLSEFLEWLSFELFA